MIDVFWDVHMCHNPFNIHGLGEVRELGRYCQMKKYVLIKHGGTIEYNIHIAHMHSDD